MAKAKTKPAPRRVTNDMPMRLTGQGMDAAVAGFLTNELFSLRSRVLSNLIDPRRDLNKECGYPEAISATQYRDFYDRSDVAARVVEVWPVESWAMGCEVYEQEEPEDTEFEKAWADLNKTRQVYHYLQRVDKLSGVGTFGVLLIGLDDNQALEQPAAGIDEKGEPGGQGGVSRKVTYFRAFDESLVQVAELEKDANNPRYGQPTFYTLNFADPRNFGGSGAAVSGLDATTQRVHWSRVIHVADNRGSSEVWGTPRMQRVFNRLCDLRKILGGSGEMFWKGGFPGYSFEMNPDVDSGATIDGESIRKEFDSYSNGLQRYLALTGLQAKTLGSQVADPGPHVQAQLQAIAVTLEIPLRVLMGTEEAKLASGQDAVAWARRVRRRQVEYLTPLLVLPLVTRLMALGVLPTIEEPKVDWPDLAAPSDDDKATIAQKRMDAVAKYLAAGADTLIAPKDFLVTFLGMDPEEAEAVLDSAVEQIAKIDAEELVPGRDPTPVPPPIIAPAPGQGPPKGPPGATKGKPVPAAPKPAAVPPRPGRKATRPPQAIAAKGG